MFISGSLQTTYIVYDIFIENTRSKEVEMKEKIKAYIDLTLAMCIAGSAVTVSKIMVDTIPTFLATEIGIMIGLLILLPVTFIVKKEFFKINLKTTILLLAQAICGILLYRIFTFWGLNFTSAANSGLISSSAPAIIVILAYVILKEKVKLKSLMGLLMVLIGLFSINLFTYFSEGTVQNSIYGNLLTLAAVICEAFFSVLSKIKCSPMSALFRTSIIVSFAFLCLLPFAAYDAYNFDFETIPIKTVICLVYYGTCVSFLSYVLWFKGIDKVKASEAAVFTSIVPISSILLTVLLLKEKISFIHIIGMVFIIIGILVSVKE